MRTAAPLAVAALLAACAQSHVLPHEDYCARLSEAGCRGIECCSDPARRHADVATCIEEHRGWCEALFAGEAFEAGLVVYDDVAAVGWVEAIAIDAERCTADQIWVAPNPTYGTAGEGTPCLARGDDRSWVYVCAPGLYCSTPEGVCRPLPSAPEPGDQCESSASCPFAFFCGDEGVCMRRLAYGAPCDEDRMCGTGYCVEGACGWSQEAIDDGYCAR